jgi:F-type H+-transporting ATPase subunit b
MQLILQQLETLLLGSLPTALLFIVLVLAYQFLVQQPLTAVLAKRRALTKGAVEEAEKAIAAAEQRSAEYEAKLRQARTELFKAREQRILQWTAERELALEVARKAAGAKVGEAQALLDADVAKARTAIEAAASELGKQVMQAVLPVAAGGSR